MPFSLGRRHDRFHLRRDQLEGRRRGRRNHRRTSPGSGEPAPEFAADRATTRTSSILKRPTLDAVAVERHGRAGRARRGRSHAVASPTVHFAWEDGPLPIPRFGRSRVPDIAARSRRRACRPAVGRARNRRGGARQPTAAAAPRSIARCRMAYDFAVAAEREPRRLCRDPRGIGREGAGPRADDPDRQARVRHRLRQDAADRVRGRAELTPQRAGCRASAASSGVHRDQAGRAQGTGRRRAQGRRPEPKPDTKAEAAKAKLRAAPPIALETVSAESRIRAGPHPPQRRTACMEPVALVDDEAMVERAIRRAGL